MKPEEGGFHRTFVFEYLCSAFHKFQIDLGSTK